MSFTPLLAVQQDIEPLCQGCLQGAPKHLPGVTTVLPGLQLLMDEFPEARPYGHWTDGRPGTAVLPLDDRDPVEDAKVLGHERLGLLRPDLRGEPHPVEFSQGLLLELCPAPAPLHTELARQFGFEELDGRTLGNF